MRVVVANTSVPFLRGGAEHLADSLVVELSQRGHEVELLKVPFRWASPQDVAESMVAAASLRVPEADRMIALKFPAYLVPHEHKVIWLLHQFRQVYELWGTALQDLPAGPESEALRSTVHAADVKAFSDARGLYCNSRVTADRLRRYNGLDGSVMLAPLGDPTMFQSGPFGDYILATGRITSAKRQFMLLDALARTDSGVRLIVAGAPESPGEMAALQSRIRESDVHERLQLIPRYISDEEKVALLSNARAVAYVPVDEDSYGYVTAEAMLSGKPVITCSDSGGVLELVEDGRTGLVCAPEPGSLARAMERLTRDPGLARTLGAAGRARVQALALSWDNTIERLLR